MAVLRHCRQRLSCVVLWLLTACSTEQVLHAQVKPQEPSFEKDIQPLLKERCWKCHGETVQKGELALHTPALIEKGSESGPVIISGKPSESRLFELIKHGEMPPDQQGRLSEDEVELFRKWIDAGASFGDQKQPADRKVTQHDVIPILLLRCTACHGRQKQENGLDLRSRASMLKGGKSGPAFVSGKPDESLLLKRILAEEMPPHRRLTEVSVKPMEPDETRTLSKWIEQGAPLADEEPDLAGTAEDPLVRPQDKDFWSFRALIDVPIPELNSSAVTNNVLSAASSPQNPIDSFIGWKLAEHQLSFAPAADRSTLLRRMTFDLTGLPPTPFELQQFLTDDSADAIDRVCDRLLASPRYGESWARHWLDLAGYAECEGRREQHLPRPFAWRYRDYVIRSLNADKPYDRFLLEQIAGDELADYENSPQITQEMEDNLVATAFLRLAPDPTWANLTGYVPDRLEVIGDSIDVLGAGVLGLTFKCARCHTHKFDPIPQRDYYRLTALLKGAYDEHDWLKPQLTSYGGAMSAGFGERFLPYVSSDERKRWERHEADINVQLEQLKAKPQSPEQEKQIRELESRRQPEPRVMALWDRGDPSPTYVYRRGNHATSGAFVSPGVPAALMNSQKRFDISPPWPGARSTGRRLALGRWLVDSENPLTARVMVNRIWKHHFGHGIVRTLGNFGKTGDRPSHPELLDYLSREWIRKGWGMKDLHRQLVLSQTWQQQSIADDSGLQHDSRNQWLSRMPLRRLEAEELRDSILVLADHLNDSSGGPSEPILLKSDGLVLTGQRRSIYVQHLRKHLPSLLESFDLPAMNPNCLERTESLVPTQALHLWNDTAIRQLADHFADRVLNLTTQQLGKAEVDDGRLIDQLFLIAISREPRPEEKDVCIATLVDLRNEWKKQNSPALDSDQISRRSLAALCHTILNSAAFLYID